MPREMGFALKPPETWAPRQGVNSALGDALYNDIDPQRMKVRERPVDRRITELATQGYTNKEIATMLELTPVTVSNTLRQPWARERMVKRMKEDANAEIRAMLEKAAPEAVQRVISLAETAQGTELGYKADKEILDRYLGRAVQPITNDVKDFDKLSDEELERIAAGAVVVRETAPNGNGS